MTTVITHNVLSFTEWFNKNNEFMYQQYCMYRGLDDRTPEDYQEFLQKRYNEYVTTQPTIKELQRNAFIKFSQEYPDEAREILLSLND